MDILGELGIEKSILVLNKCDLVEEDWLELVKEEIKEEWKAHSLNRRRSWKCRQATGQGIPELIEDYRATDCGRSGRKRCEYDSASAD